MEVQNSSPNAIASRLVRNVQSFLENADDLFYFLEAWIRHRKNTLEMLDSDRKSPTSCIPIASGSMCSSVANKITHLDTKLAAIANTVSFGFTCGIAKGQEAYNNRRLSNVTEQLKEDAKSTADLKDTIEKVVKNLIDLLKDLQDCSNLQAGQQNSSPVLRDIRSILRNPSGTVEYQPLIGWSDQVIKLMLSFVDILKHTKVPNEQIEDLLRRNPQPEVFLEKSELEEFVRVLQNNYYAIENARNSAQENSVTATNLFQRMVLPATSGVTSPAVGSSPSPPFRRLSAEKTCEIDRWFEEVRQMIAKSLEIANLVKQHFTQGNIPFQGNSQSQN